MSVIKDWLITAANQLKLAGVDSARLDSELILANVLKKDRTYLHAHADQLIEPLDEEAANHQIELRKNRLPIAYITGYKEFYGQKFIVTPDTLIPRPESEDIISAFKSLVDQNPELLKNTVKLVDVGTGSGCLGITLKLLFPNLDVTLSDISQPALDIAHQNADHLGANIKTLKSNLLEDYLLKADFIIANLPYVDPAWERSPETNYEPASALFAANEGMDLIIKLIDQTKIKLKSTGYLILEADPIQHSSLIDYAKQSGLKFISVNNYCLVLRRI